jgi:hypothetical protein
MTAGTKLALALLAVAGAGVVSAAIGAALTSNDLCGYETPPGETVASVGLLVGMAAWGVGMLVASTLPTLRLWLRLFVVGLLPLASGVAVFVIEVHRASAGCGV